PDLYDRSGEGITIDMSKLISEGPSGPTAARMMSVVGTVKPDKVVADIKAIFDVIGSAPAAAPGARVCVGYCLGARLALHVASAIAGEFVAAAGIHPGALVSDQPD